MKKAKKIIGIMGGLGPEATVDLYMKIIRTTVKQGAKKDQDHIETVISCVPQTPDRTLAIEGKAPPPVPYLVKSAKRLEKAGVDFIVMPCNTGHYFIRDIQKSVNIPVISMIEESAKVIKKRHKKIKTVGLLATTGTVKTGIYKKTFERFGFKVIAPYTNIQKNRVMEAIYGKKGIKSGKKSILPKKYLKEAANHLIKRGAQIIVLGCTEIPIELKQKDVKIPIIDATQVLAEVAVRKALA